MRLKENNEELNNVRITAFEETDQLHKQNAKIEREKKENMEKFKDIKLNNTMLTVNIKPLEETVVDHENKKKDLENIVIETKAKNKLFKSNNMDKTEHFEEVTEPESIEIAN